MPHKKNLMPDSIHRFGRKGASGYNRQSWGRRLIRALSIVAILLASGCGPWIDADEHADRNPATCHWYPDRDGDGAGDSRADPFLECVDQKAGYVLDDNTDCNDDNDEERPDQIWYPDNDGDGFGFDNNQADGSRQQCKDPGEIWVGNDNDCDDTVDSVHPAAVEICDGVDTDCDGEIPTDELDNDGDDFSICDGDCDDEDNGAYPGLSWYPDADGDGDGDASAAPSECEKASDSDVLNNDDCNDNDADEQAGAVWYPDADGDGFGDDSAVGQQACLQPGNHVADDTDCDDQQVTVFPGNAEVCDGLDNDCANGVDDGLPLTLYYVDSDGDGYGDEADSGSPLCADPLDGRVDNGTDCDDDHDVAHPAGTEVCDGLDNDCLGGPEANEVDGDGDTYVICDLLGDWEGPGNVGGGLDCDDNAVTVHPLAQQRCDGLANDCTGFLPLDEQDLDGDNYVECPGWEGVDPSIVDGDDCDGGDPTAFPANPESCDGIDNDCNNDIDDTLIFTPYYSDADADGFGDDSDPGTSLCADPLDGRVASDNTDCDDSRDTVSPTGVEVCDGLDNDCSGAPHATEVDGDGDTYVICELLVDWEGPGNVGGGLDCDDNAITVHPLAQQRCDGVANDCTAFIPLDEQDLDGDGYVECIAWEGVDPTILAGDDCDGGDPTAFPGNPELCDGIDNDCNTNIDDTLIFTPYYADADADGFGDDSDPGTSLCADPLDGRVASDNTDCDDSRDTVSPTGVEVCDGLDNDCSGAPHATEVDGDGDTYVICELLVDWEGPGNVGGGLDCDDNAITVHPLAQQRCDGVANDCTAFIPLDEQDLDLDGYVECTAWEGVDPTILAGDDCDGGDPTAFPGNPEICDGIDNDCANNVDDGLIFTPYYADADSDGFGDDNDPGTLLCADPLDGRVANDNTDCDDSFAAVSPIGVEACDGLDNDCSGAPHPTEVDDDGDFYVVCELLAPWLGPGNVAGGEDCDDNDATVHPLAQELCDGLANDCGLVVPADEVDNDSDGYVECPNWVGAPAITVGSDCDDSEPAANPGAVELCDGIDNDCANGIDDALVFTRYYPDTDGDTYGDSSDVGILYCADPLDGTVADNTDCDDNFAQVNQAELEVCDGLDNDCSGAPGADEIDSDGDAYIVCALIGTWEGPGNVAGGGDCDDNDTTVRPLAPELCDGLDNDCLLGIPDDEIDDDSDGFVECTAWIGDVAISGSDCDDGDIARFPGNAELCDNLDNDCDLALWVDEIDGDGDRFVRCTLDVLPWAAVDGGDDCDDADPDSWPAAPELCDGIDNNCDLVVPGDEIDGDIDGVVECAGDCDDLDPTVFVGAPELCDGIDNDCDLAIPLDELDSDGDNAVECAYNVLSWAGDPAVTAGLDCDGMRSDTYVGAPELCDGRDNDCDLALMPTEEDGDGDFYVICTLDGPPWALVIEGQDCDDGDNTRYPSAPELCDGLDNDCLLGVPADELDSDSDGYVSCNSWTGADLAIVDGGDCDDTEPLESPGLVEVCDGNDSDCSGDVDDGLLFQQWYIDSDADNYGSAAIPALYLCLDPGDRINVGGDCNDSDATRYPTATEICDGQANACETPLTPDDERDDDADGYVECDPTGNTWVGPGTPAGGDCDDADNTEFPGVQWWPDADGDGDGDDLAVASECERGPSGDVTNNADCDDTDPLLNASSAWYPDTDADTYGDESALAVQQCVAPANHVLDNTDCHDGQITVFPGNPEVCDGFDNDCAGGVDNGIVLDAYFIDSDLDGYGDLAGGAVFLCVDDPDDNRVANSDDCDDTRGDLHPGALEFCDGFDWDCDGDGFDFDASDANEFYPDVDNDAYGDPTDPLTICDPDPPSGWLFDNTDCDDALANVHPGEPEVCDGLDNDCANGIDDSPVVDPSTWYEDVDGDLYGNTQVRSCTDPGGWIQGINGDCDDLVFAVNPGVAEFIGDDIDNDCDGLADGGLVVDEAIVIRGTQNYFGSAIILPGDLNGDGLAEVVATTARAGSVNYAYIFNGPILAGTTIGDADGNIVETNVVNDLTLSEGGHGFDLTGSGKASLIVGIQTPGPCQPDGFSIYEVGINGMDGSYTRNDSYAQVSGNTGADNHADMRNPVPTASIVGDANPDLATITSYNPTSCSGLPPNVVSHLLFAGPLANTDSINYLDAFTEIRGVTETTGGSNSAAGDLNGDGEADMLFGQNSEGYFVFLGPIPGGLFVLHDDADISVLSAPTSHNIGAQSFRSVDMNKDGRRDIFAATEQGDVFIVDASDVLANAPSMILEDHATTTIVEENIGDQVGRYDHGIDAADIDQDGEMDLVATSLNNDDNGADAGKAYLFWGPMPQGVVSASDADRFWLGEVVGGQSFKLGGISPDIDGGGLPDIVFHDENWSTDLGSIYIISGENL